MRIGVACGGMLIGCSIFVTTPALAQDSKALVAADPRAAYAIVKKIYRSTFAKPITLKEFKRINGNDPTYLTDCLDTELFFGTKLEPLLVRLGDFAGEIINIEDGVSFYPKALWESDLRSYEEKMLVILADEKRVPERLKPDDESGAKYKAERDFKRALAARLNRYQQDHRNLPKVDPGPAGCGDGEVPVAIKTEPKASRIQYLSRYMFDFCAEQKKDPLDSRACNRWTDYTDDTALSGRYKIYVSWSDGKTLLRDIDVDTIKPDRRGNRNFIIRQ